MQDTNQPGIKMEVRQHESPNPRLKGFIKVHKDNMPIRPVVDYSEAPAYYLAKELNNILDTFLPLPNAFNVTNSLQLMNEVSDIPFTTDLHFASLDMADMYSNVPTDDIEHIIRSMCVYQDINTELMSEILAITQTILSQNYYGYNERTYVQPKGLAMGSPSSSVLSELYIQHMEHTKATHTLTKPGIVAYFRYVDDILLIYNKRLIDIEDVLSSLNIFCPNLKFTLEREKDNKLNFLDINIEKTNTSFSYNIYRKDTTTDTIIPMDSNHPLEHKMAAIRYLINRANTYNLHPTQKQTEMDNIMHILHNNGYNPSVIDVIQRQKQSPRQPQDTGKQKWARFTYSGKATRTVTKFFQQAGIRIAYCKKNNLGNILRRKSTDNNNNIYTNSGIYQLTCPTCEKTYTGITLRRIHANNVAVEKQ